MRALEKSGLHEPITLLPGISYQHIANFRESGTFGNPFLKLNAFNLLMAERFAEIQRFPAHLLGGITSVKGHWLVGPFCTFVNPATREVPNEFPLMGMNRFGRAVIDAFPAAPTRVPLEGEPRPLHFAFSADKLRPLAEGIVLDLPGWGIYGHWLLDMVPRLTIVRQMLAMEQHRGSPLYHYGLPPFASKFLAALGIEAPLVQLEPGIAYDAPVLHLPAPTKMGHWVNLDLLGQSMRTLRVSALAHRHEAAEAGEVRIDPLLLDPPELVYFSRAKWGTADSTRRLHNQAEMSVALGKLGFATVHAEDYSFGELTVLLSRARIIVGEDGSALHNIVFAEPGCALIAVMPATRMNMWHGSFCAAMGHRIAFQQAAENKMVALDELTRLVEQVQGKAPDLQAPDARAPDGQTPLEPAASGARAA